MSYYFRVDNKFTVEDWLAELGSFIPFMKELIDRVWLSPSDALAC